jgi:hypothetical protein
MDAHEVVVQAGYFFSLARLAPFNPLRLSSTAGSQVDMARSLNPFHTTTK